MTTVENKSRMLADLEYLEQHIAEAAPEELSVNASYIYNLTARNISKIVGTSEEHLKIRYIALVNKVLKYLPTAETTVKPINSMQGVIHKDKIKEGLSDLDIIREYITKRRWNSFYHQIEEIVSANPKSILEVGVGSGLLRAVLTGVYHCIYNSLDIGEHLHPDYVGSVLDMPFADNTYDVVGCFQVLEHLPFENFERALSEICRVARKRVVVSLPDAASERTPVLPNKYDGEHYWEINRIDFEFPKIKEIIQNIAKHYQFELEREYRVAEMPYHHFFVLNRTISDIETLPLINYTQPEPPQQYNVKSIQSLQTQIAQMVNSILKITPQPILKMIIYNIVAHCNLNCKGCMSLSPIMDEHFVSTEDIVKDLRQLSKITNNSLMLLELQGGEPLLHPDLINIFSTARNIFPNTTIKIVSNGILLPNQTDAFWIACNRNKIEIAVTKYPIDLDYSFIEKKARDMGVTFSYYGTTNIKARTLYKDIFDLKGTQDPRRNFLACTRANCYTNIREGKIYPCAVILNATHFNSRFNLNMKIDNTDYLDIYAIEQYKDLATFLATPKPFCRYCDPTKRIEGIPWSLSKRELSEWV